MDVVPSAANSKDLFVYVVNHQPFSDRDAVKSGANSTIEIFKTRVGASTLTHLHTVQDPIISSPHDIIGSSDGKSFHFTSAAGDKYGVVGVLSLQLFERAFIQSFCKQMSSIDILLGMPVSSVGYCHVNEGCKLAAPKITGASGIARANDTFYIANSIRGTITVLELQSDHSLVLADVIQTGASLILYICTSIVN